MSIFWNAAEQGSEDWLEARRGRITGSRFKDARDRKKNGDPSDKMLTYAMDVAREREGGKAPEKFQNSAMRIGQEAEPIGRMKYEADTGELVEEVGFAYTEDGKFGLSPDGLIGTDGVWECKTMVSSATLFAAMIEGDVSEYRDQCLGYLWLLHRKWVDLTLYCPDLDVVHTVRIERDEDEIQRLVDDLMAFDKLVESYRVKLRGFLSKSAQAPAAPAPVEAPAAPAVRTVAPSDVPMSIFD